MAAGVSAAEGRSGKVILLRTPSGGIQPQAAADGSGAIHLVYFVGDPTGGDLDYTRFEPNRTGFAPPVRINSGPGSAVARGTIRGAQVALGRDGRVHVAWNGAQNARPANPNGGSPMLYARSDKGRVSFEPERNLMQQTSALDGGGTVTAGEKGLVLVAWHGRAPGAPQGESGRRMFIARSDDGGATFAPEKPVLSVFGSGACACCGARALAVTGGNVYLLFRAATGGTERDMMLLSSHDRGEHFEGVRLDPWRSNLCPMSSETLAEGAGNVVAAWETRGQVYFAPIDKGDGGPFRPVHPPGDGGNRKHPAVAVNALGEVLLAWTEDTSFLKGGALVWQLYDAQGKPTADTGRVDDGIPRDSLPTAVARPDGGFTIVH